MKKYILTVTLNPAIDKSVTVPNFIIGRDYREKGISMCAGGKGINVSRVLTHLNINNIATGFLGGPNGAYIENRLKEEKIKSDFLRVKDNNRTSLTILDTSLNLITRILEQGPKVTKKEIDDFRKKYITLLKNAKCVVLSGRSVPGAKDGLYGDLIELAAKSGIPSVLDTSGRAYEVSVKKKPYMIKPNLKEAEQVLGFKLFSGARILRAIECFHKMGVKVVAITMGARGAIASDGKSILKAVPPTVKRKSHVGCGDAFIAGFVTGHLGGDDLSNSLKLGIACGTANALSIDPGYIESGTVKNILIDVSIKDVKK